MKKTDWIEKIPAYVQSMPAYTPIEPFEVLSRRMGRKPEEIVKLDANENPYGPSPRARQALSELRFPHIYPDPESRELREALSVFTGVPARYLLAGSGVDELLDLLLRALLELGDAVLVCPPTFGMYAFDTRLNAGRVIEAPRRDDFSLDLDAIQAAIEAHHPKVLFVATPNNPDGSMPTPDVIDALLELPVLVVLDEAYIEFSGLGRLGAGGSRIVQAPERENLIVLRTFSKWAGLAGLRVGYGAFPEWLLPTLWKAKQPYNVNVAASAAAIASLQDSDALAETVARLIAERERLARELGRLSFLQPYPSWANFLLCKVLSAAQPGDKGIYSGAGLKEALSCQGIMVRYFDTPRLWDYIRISAGRPEDTEKLLVCLNRLREPDTIPAPVRSSVEGENPTAAGAGLPASSPASGRRAQIRRTTRETSIDLSLNLDGCGQAEIDTGLGFFDHMLMQIAVHGLFDLCIHASGDLHVDAHHTVEDVALALGKAFDQALGERTGIQRAASFTFPMDEALAVVAVDFSGRPYAVIEVGWKTPAIGAIPTSLFDHFFESFAAAARCNLHARLLYGRDDHHQAEALFKALARVLDAATQIDPRRADRIPSSKGLL